ncbi:hypothetical protein Barb7_02986 [Bacteroidales bacterium Barb7]|nr:hypothetical protein Barb7_02986 [Bacteroidales bacterium Barb7]
MFLYAGGNSQHIGVEDNILRGKSRLLRQETVGAGAYLNLAFIRVRLPFLVKSHHNGGGTQSADTGSVLQEDGFTFFQGNGIDDALALYAHQPPLNHFPLGRVNHHGDTGYIRLRGYQIEESSHLLDGIQHTIVHIDVNHLRTVLYLLAGKG